MVVLVCFRLSALPTFFLAWLVLVKASTFSDKKPADIQDSNQLSVISHIIKT